VRPKSVEPRIFEFRIKYNEELNPSALDSFRYYSATSAENALDFHQSAMKNRGTQGQTISIEEKNPYSCAWEDRSHVIKEKLE